MADPLNDDNGSRFMSYRSTSPVRQSSGGSTVQIFSTEALRKSIETLPTEQGGIGVAVDGTDIGVQGAVKKDISKGWSVAAAGSWFKDKGYQAAAWLGWKGASR